MAHSGKLYTRLEHHTLMRGLVIHGVFVAGLPGCNNKMGGRRTKSSPYTKITDGHSPRCAHQVLFLTLQLR